MYLVCAKCFAFKQPESSRHKKETTVPITNLTARSVVALKPPPPTQQVTYWDESLPGFGVRVSYRGTKTWTVMYRHSGHVRRYRLGRVDRLDLADARKRAKQLLAAVDDGGDPAAQRADLRAGKTFGELAKEYLERHAKVHKKSWRQDERMINQEPLPRWKDRKLAEISRADVREMIEGMAERGAPIHANRMLAVVRKMFNFAADREWINQNPCFRVKPPGKERSRERVLDEDEIRKVWTALDNQTPPIRDMFRLRLITAQRGGEVLQMRWDEVDLQNGWWTMPGVKVKNGRPHRVFLTEKVVTILTELKAWYEQRLAKINSGRAKKHLEPRTMSEYVFPSPDGEQAVAWVQKAAQRIRDASGVIFVPHDLRRTAATMMSGNGTPRAVLKMILNHVDRDITAVYDRYSYDAEKEKALTAWGKKLESILSEKPGAAVVRFRLKRAV